MEKQRTLRVARRLLAAFWACKPSATAAVGALLLLLSPLLLMGVVLSLRDSGFVKATRLTRAAAVDRDRPTRGSPLPRSLALAGADASDGSSTRRLPAPPKTRPRSRPTVVVLFWTPFWGASFETAMLHQGLRPSWPCSRFCELTYDRRRAPEAHAVLFHAWDYKPWSAPAERSAAQLWVLFHLEPPPLGFITDEHDRAFNLTATYRKDSDLTVGYGHYSAAGEQRLPHTVTANFERRRPHAYWMVSNCASDRMDYVKRLSQYIRVTIVGKCAPTNTSWCAAGVDCDLELSSTHAFYLAFENALCPDYVTEKLWRTLASRGGAIPVVIGAPLSYYEAVAPPDSFIHAENFTSVRELGAFLTKVASSRDAFLYYHRWRARYDVHVGWYSELARGVCRLCESLHRGAWRSAPMKTNLSRWFNAGCRPVWPP